MGRAGPPPRVLPPWIWDSAESHTPQLSQRAAVAHINTLLARIGERPIKRSWYQNEAARRAAQRLALGAAGPAANGQVPVVDLVSVDGETEQSFETSHSLTESPADEPTTPFPTTTDEPIPISSTEAPTHDPSHEPSQAPTEDPPAVLTADPTKELSHEPSLEPMPGACDGSESETISSLQLPSDSLLDELA